VLLVKALTSLLSLVIVVVAGLAVLGGLLAFTGSPDACVVRVTDSSSAASNELKAAWRTFESQSARGSATLTISEAQATSRGVEHLDEKDVPVDDLQVYFCPDGYAEASGKIDAAGLKAKVIVRGTLDLSGDKPRIEIDSVRAGNLPSFVAKPAVDVILDTGNFRTLDVDVNLTTIEFTDGTARVTGAP